MAVHLSGPKLLMSNKTISDECMHQLEKNNGLFGIDCYTGKEYSYPQLKKDVFAVAAAFQKAKLGRGDLIMVLDFSSYEGQVILLAGHLIKAVIAAVYNNFKISYLEVIINKCKPDVLFCDSTSNMNKLTDLVNSTTHQSKLKISTTVHEGFITFSSVVAASDNLFKLPKNPLKENDLCAIQHSSGSTGVPNGILLSHNSIKSCSMKRNLSFLEEPVENKLMITNGVSSSSGLKLLFLGIKIGRPRLFFSSDPTTEQILYSIDKYKPTLLWTTVASSYKMMSCQISNNHKYNIKSLSQYLVSGTLMPSKLQKIITENLLQKRIKIKLCYGCSEQGIMTQWPSDSDINTVKDGSVGKPAPGINIKVACLETGLSLCHNTIGEIRIKSMYDMYGYINDFKKTLKAYDEDGWFKTGDIGYYTNDGYLFIVSRIKDVLTYNNRRISPADIETVLLSHFAVLDAGVTGRDSSLGDLLVGVIKLKQDQNIEADQVVSYVNDRVDHWEKLRGGVIIVNEIPRTPTGKLNRGELKNLVRLMSH